MSTPKGPLMAGIVFGVLVAWALSVSPPASADVKLPQFFSNSMVLQRGRRIPIWGWADPHEEITIHLWKDRIRVEADAKGMWMTELPSMEAGGPYRIAVSGKNAIILEDILIGEVWVCSGQSNMEMALKGVLNHEREIADADNPDIRLLHVPKRTSGLPLSDIRATWHPCHPGTAASFSAVAYFFGRELHRELGVPIGLIATSWGGTRIEPWIPPAGFASVPRLQDMVEQIEQANRTYKQAVGPALDHMESWAQAAREALVEGDSLLPPPDWPKHALDALHQPTALYNGMVHPLAPFAIRGAIWYQGESNCLSADGMMYHHKMKALIEGWRKVWNQDEMPFYFVQLAPFNYARFGTSPFELPKIWEAQTESLFLPNTGMAVTIDIGDVSDIHPRNKQDVGKRLALWALANAYGRSDLVHSGPLYKSMAVDSTRIRISFDHVGSGLMSRDGQPLAWFEIAGADSQFVEAQAIIEEDQVVVWSEGVPEPIAVRFGWHEEAVPNLSNQEGLPASPFRTHRW